MPGLAVTAQNKIDAELAAVEIETALREGASAVSAEDTVAIAATFAALDGPTMAIVRNVMKAVALVAFRRRAIAPELNDDTPSGVISGTDGADGNGTFDLGFVPRGGWPVLHFKNGLLQLPGTHFNLVGNQVVYLSGHIPIVGDWHRTVYWS